MSKVFYDEPVVWQMFSEINKCWYMDEEKLINLAKRLPPEDVNAYDDWGDTILILACRNKYTEVIGILLENEGINVNLRDFFGSTVLLYALKQGHIDIVRLLLNHKDINVNIKDAFGRTPLMIAREKGYTEMVELLENYQKN